MIHLRPPRKAGNVLGLDFKIFDHYYSSESDSILLSHQVKMATLACNFPDLGNFLEFKPYELLSYHVSFV